MAYFTIAFQNTDGHLKNIKIHISFASLPAFQDMGDEVNHPLTGLNELKF